MGNEKSHVIDFAKSQVGYAENPLGSNHQKYGAMLDKIPWYLYKEGTKEWIHQVDYHNWCTQFVDASFISTYGIDNARKMLYRPVYNNYGAVVKYAFNYFKQNGKGFTKEEHKPCVGDIIYFQNDAGLSHTGIVIAVGENTVTTIEGNAGKGSNYVIQKTYEQDDDYIYGYGVPLYDAEKYPNTPFKAINILHGVAIRDIPYSDGKIIGTVKDGAEVIVEELGGSSGDFAKISGWVYLPKGFKW